MSLMYEVMRESHNNNTLSDNWWAVFLVNPHEDKYENRLLPILSEEEFKMHSIPSGRTGNTAP